MVYHSRCEHGNAGVMHAVVVGIEELTTELLRVIETVKACGEVWRVLHGLELTFAVWIVVGAVWP